MIRSSDSSPEAENYLSILDEVKPRSKQRIIDLVCAAGIDVSEWSKFAGGRRRAATNPKYCYEWSFLDPGRLLVLNLWHKKLHEEAGTVWLKVNFRESARKFAERGNGIGKVRATRCDLALKEAAKNRLPVRAVIIDGAMRNWDDPSGLASRVERRLLDPVPRAGADLSVQVCEPEHNSGQAAHGQHLRIPELIKARVWRKAQLCGAT